MATAWQIAFLENSLLRPETVVWTYYLRQGGYVVVVDVGLSVSNFAQKLLNGFA